MTVDSFNIMHFLRMYFFIICNFYISIRIVDIKEYWNLKYKTVFIIWSFIISCVCQFTSEILSDMNNIIYIIILTTVVFSKITKNKFGYSIFISTISTSINIVILFFAIIIGFFIHLILNIQDKNVEFLLIILMYVFIKSLIMKTNLLKNLEKLILNFK